MTEAMDKISEIMGKGRKLKPKDVKEMEVLSQWISLDELDYWAWIQEGLFLIVDDKGNKNFFPIIKLIY